MEGCFLREGPIEETGIVRTEDGSHGYRKRGTSNAQNSARCGADYPKAQGTSHWSFTPRDVRPVDQSLPALQQLLAMI